MSTQVQGTLLDVLKKKMRQTKEEMEKYKDECEEYHKRLQVEVMRREEVSVAALILDDAASCILLYTSVFFFSIWFLFYLSFLFTCGAE